jgi:hypothetical protein
MFISCWLEREHFGIPNSCRILVGCQVFRVGLLQFRVSTRAAALFYVSQGTMCSVTPSLTVMPVSSCTNQATRL